MKISQFMTKSIVTLKPHDTIKDAAVLMLEHNIGFIPIVDDDNKAVGCLTDRDIVIRGIAQGNYETTRLEDIMSTSIVSLHPDDEIGSATHVMGHRQIRRILVVDDNDKLVGVLAMADISTRPESDAIAGIALSQISMISTDIESNPHNGTDVMDFPL